MYLFDKTFNQKFRSYDDIVFAPDIDLDNHVAVLDPQWYQTDWLIEPPESIEELRKQRAQQLRDKYDYLVLYYSGGSDSQTVMNSFVNNNIDLDQIVISVPSHSIDPRLTLQFAIDVVNNSQFKGILTINKVRYSKKMVIDFGKRTSPSVNPSHARLRCNLNWYNKAPVGQTNVGHIYGRDKAEVIKTVGGKIKAMISLSKYLLPSGRSNGRPGSGGEDFYLTADLPQLYIKECYILRNYALQHDIKATDDTHVNLLLRDDWDHTGDWDKKSGSWAALDKFGKATMDKIRFHLDDDVIYSPPLNTEHGVWFKEICEKIDGFYDVYVDHCVKTYIHNLPIARMFDKYGSRRIFSQYPVVFNLNQN